jgi:hypothetical protein
MHQLKLFRLFLKRQSITNRQSEADCLSRIVLSYAPRQATVSLTLDVRYIAKTPSNLTASHLRVAHPCLYLLTPPTLGQAQLRQALPRS